MEIIIHRVNTVKYLKTIPAEFGCEIDVRAEGKSLILNHNPLDGGESYDAFLDEPPVAGYRQIGTRWMCD